MSMPRILTIMGSGETTPTMARVHRAILDRLGKRPVPAVVLDTPYGFQENADDITGRTLEYFRVSVGAPFSVASFRSADADALARETALARIREARLVFAGPGSPSYALRQWSGSEIPRLLARKLADGGAVTMASAAALTLGRFTIPVYEIYKVGEAPRWLAGLDLLTPLGLPVAVVPHYDNAEGGNHDTRFCYLGERRLRVLEAELPEEVFILGVDGHTALVLDLDAGTASVLGLGTVTVRKDGRSTVFPAGSEVPIAGLVEAAGNAGSVDVAASVASPPGASGTPAEPVAVPAPARGGRESGAGLQRVSRGMRRPGCGPCHPGSRGDDPGLVERHGSIRCPGGGAVLAARRHRLPGRDGRRRVSRPGRAGRPLRRRAAGGAPARPRVPRLGRRRRHSRPAARRRDRAPRQPRRHDLGAAPDRAGELTALRPDSPP